MAVDDFNADGKQDIAVANYNSGTVSILLGDGNAGFQSAGNLTGFQIPYDLITTDLNHDNKPDLVVANVNSGKISVLSGNGDGSFVVVTNISTGNSPEGIAAGDLNNDNQTDLVVANSGNATATVLLGDGTGMFEMATNLQTGKTPAYVAIADVTGDGVPDIVTLLTGDNSISIFQGNGDGTFRTPRTFLDNTTQAHTFALADVNGDGFKDVIVPGYGNNTFNVLLNDGSGGFTNLYAYNPSGSQYPIAVAVGDFDGDGRTDLAFGNYYGNSVTVWTGNPVLTLSENPPGSGLRTVLGRGMRSDASDVDYWRFSGKAGDHVIVAVDVPGNPSSSQLYFQVMEPDGVVLTSFYADSTGWGQSGIITLPSTETYLVRVARNNDFQGEYQLRVTLATAPLQLETEGNGSPGTADKPSLVLSNGIVQGALAGYLSVGDTSDYYNLGNLPGGANINLGVKEPEGSGLGEILWIYNSGNILLTNSAAGVTNFNFTIPPGQDDVYYVRVTGSSSGFSGSSDTALHFSGGNDHVDLGDWFDYQTFTLSMWVNPGSSQNSDADILDNNHHTGISWVIEQNGNNVNQYAWLPQDNGDGVPFSLDANTWQNLTITRDSTNISRVYLNGVLVGSNAAPGQINYNGSQFLSIARWVGGSSRGWNGTMDDLRIWNRALSQPEIVANMNAGLSGNEPNVIGDWPFNEGAGTNAYDFSPSNHIGFLVNNPAWTFLAGTNALPQGLNSQYILSIALSNAVSPEITGVSLPTNGATSADIISSFSVDFSEDMDARFSTLSRNVYAHDGNSYLLTDNSISWPDAQAAAESVGGNLVAIGSSAENDWLNQTFSGFGELWIGLNMRSTNGTWTWPDGESFAFSNWTGGAPNNGAGDETAVKMRTDGAWDDDVAWNTRPGIIEINGGADSDNDGWVDSLDPYPDDPMNAFDLRAAGTDGIFDTPDDVVYRVYTTGYTDGLSAAFSIADGPLEPGNYRFKITTSLKDRFGNPLIAPFVRTFTIEPIGGFITENRRDASGTSTTSLSLNFSNQLDGSFNASSSVGGLSNPYSIAQGYFNSDTNLDIVTANWSAGGITVLTNDGHAAFSVSTNIPTGNNPIFVLAANLNGDAHPDLAVANYNSGTVSILSGDGEGGFTLTTNIPGFSTPENLAAGDFNHDGKMDLVVPSYNGGRITVLFGTGDGNFTNPVNYTVGSQPQTVAVGNLDSDNNPDLVVANYNSSSLTVLMGGTDGAFTVTTNYSTMSHPHSVALGDVTGDGRSDAVVVNNSGYLSVLPGNGDGTFQARTDYNIGSGDTYNVVLSDINLDGALDALVPAYGADRLITLVNDGAGAFGGSSSYTSPGSNPIALVTDDFNHDGIPDIVTANYYGNNITVLLGNNTQGVAFDPAGTGLRIVAARGNLADSSDLDYWTFSAEAGDRVAIAAETVGSPAGSQLRYFIYRPDGSQWTDFYSDNNGRGQINLTIAAPGTYKIRVQPANQYYGEYRLRVTLARPPVQLESENNDSIGNADVPALSIAAGVQTATVLGYVGNYDNSGDFFKLGNLAAGTIVNLGFTHPANSGLMDGLAIYNSAGVLMSNSVAGATNLIWTVPTGADGLYYARLSDVGAVPAQTFGGQNGFALRFDSGSWISFTNGVIPTSGDFTVEAWAYAGSWKADNAYHEILSQGSGGNAFYLGITPGNRIRSGDGWGDTGVPFPFDGWHHFAIVKSSTNTLLYIDGMLVASRGSAIPNPHATDNFRISRQYSTYGESWPGDIDEVRVWNVARTPEEIQLNLTNRLTGSEPGLVGYWRFDEGTGNIVSDASAVGNTGDFQGTPVWVSSTVAPGLPSSILSQYLLNIHLSGANPPSVLSTTLPEENITTSNILDRFTVTFSQDMDPLTVSNSANYELRCAGADNIFNTADDQLYTVSNSPTYNSGTSASYLVSDGPLQPGLFRFVVSTNLADRTLNPMATNFVRHFAVANVSGFILESRTNDVSGDALLLGSNLNSPDGSFLSGNKISVGSNPYFADVGRLNADTNLDLVVANYGSGTVSILLGDGQGGLLMLTNYPIGSGAISPVLGLFNNDTNLDLAVANYNNNTISVFMGNGDGTFQPPENYPVGSEPHFVATGDFNKDGNLDLVTPNYNSGSVSILLGNGDGSFQSAVAYNAGAAPIMVAVADVNSDGILDLLTANQNGDNVSLLLGNGDGTFASPIGIAAGHQPKALALAKLNDDTNLDLIVLNAGDNTMSIMSGNGDGSFQPRVNLNGGISDGYQIATGDFNGDGEMDFAVSGYNNGVVSIFLNQGGGSFGPKVSYGLGYSVVGLTSGDFNNDGRLDLVACDYNGAGVTILPGNSAKTMPVDPPLNGFGMIAGRGNIFDNADVDYWTFGGQAGDRLLLDSDNLVDEASTGLRYRVYNPDGSELGNFAGYTGSGELTAVLPSTGTYILRVEHYYDYYGEYRFRLTLAPPPVQLESENNDSIGNADAPALTASAGHQTTSMLGAINDDDTSGDFIKLGNLAASAVIHLNYARPNSSPLVAQLSIYNSSGVLLTNGPAGQTNVDFAVPSAGAYYARITAANSSAGLFSVYVLNVDIADAAGPIITSLNLPSDGSTNTGILDRFTLGFDKDLDVSVNALNRSIQIYGGHAYTLTDSGMKWYDAETQARESGGHLVAINDLLENAFVNANFSGSGNVWLGLSDEAQHDTYVWSGGDPLIYTNWASGQPNNSSSRDYVAMQSDGKWTDVAASANYRGVIEVSGTDSDADGIPDSLDPYPYDPLNVFDLRAAGPDGLFDTSDDQIYHLVRGNYSSGLSLDFSVTDGPLQPGNYRFTVTGSLSDRFGNGLAAPFTRYFTVADVPGYVFAGRTNDTTATATPLPLIEDPAGMKSAAGRGKLFDGNDVDYWSFAGTNGEILRISVEIPGHPVGSPLRYEVFQPNGTKIADLIPDYSTSIGQSTPVVLTTNGNFILRVSPYYGYYNEYRFRVTMIDPPLQIESEGNDTIGDASPISYATNGTHRSATVAGYVRTPTDLDYINLGVVSNGYSIFLNAREPSSSALQPVVSVYNSANEYQTEAPGGRSDDGVAEVRVTQTDNYYALIRGAGGIGDLNSQYVLDIETVPTGDVSFPNLQVTSLTPPSGGGIQSGQDINYSFTVQNVGSLATPGADWSDRAVLSTDTILGNGDDIPLGFFPHTGALNSGDSYAVTKTFTLPQGISGDYYLIVSADAGNAVNEFLFEGDNTTVSASTFHINLAPYPDLRVENLNVSGPDANNVFTITWDTANRGNSVAPAGFYERFVVRNLSSGALLANVEQPVSTSLAPNATTPHSMTVTTSSAANYQVQVTTDSRDNIFEFDATSHASAEANNVAATGFSITAYYSVTTQSSPTDAGSLAGAGNYSSGSAVTVTATPITNTLPYEFVNWTEGGAFQSASSNYTFIISRDRALTANFTLPSYQISASNNPPSAGTVSGQGTYFYGTTNVLTANAGFGYHFTNWTENGSVIANTISLTNIVRSNRVFTANYVEANTLHVVTTATSPTNIATVLGSGSYGNGQTTTISAPRSITNAPDIYNFREFRVNGAFAGNEASFDKTFSTLDATNLQYVAFYDATSILPVVTQATPGFTNSVLGGFTIVTNPVPATTNYQITIRFDRTMNTNVEPQIIITNNGALLQPVVPGGGTWFSGIVLNDSYRTPFITFSNGMDGAAMVRVSGATDPNGAQMAATNIAALRIDVTPPANPTISLTASNNSSAQVSWSGYSPPSDIGSFRVYLQTTNFGSVAGLAPVSSLNSGARSFNFAGLTLDQPYYAAVVAVDSAGNSSPVVTPLQFTLASAVPPPVVIQISPDGASSALISWSDYDSSRLLGFAGFRLYFETSDFNSVSSLAPKQTFDASVKTVRVDNLDRTKTYYFAVVGYNGNNVFNPNVTTARWSDPYAGIISTNTTIGGEGGEIVDVLQNLIVSNATLTIAPGTILRFAPGTGLVVKNGALNANGTPLDPIVFTSANDQSGMVPAAGDWDGVTLAAGADASVLRNVFVEYGAGLAISNCAPTVDAFSALYNKSAGLDLQNGAALITSDALLAVNDIGAQQTGSGLLAIHHSVIKNNGTNALAGGALMMNATNNWWGAADETSIVSLLRGPVDYSAFLTGEPLLTPALGVLNNAIQVGSSSVNLRLACRTADMMRLSEDSTFNGVFFSPFTNNANFVLSQGGGVKTIFAQFRGITGETSAPVSVSVNYITSGPTITTFNLNEGELLSRPIQVVAGANAPLGMAEMEFYVDGVGQGTNSGGNLSQRFDVRNFSAGIHRVKILARDNSGNFSTREINVTISPTPPPTPAITTPAMDVVVSSGGILISGMAEPFIEVQLFRSGVLAGVTNAAANGTFNFANVALSEGANQFSAVAVDALGSASSPVRTVSLDTTPPAQLVLNPPTYTPGS
ncbi:MAG TPA: FG-GAP-like repeat-containing protein, partial [Verrucomicrobiae bacterium]|nr:FG-GAP-like repeat-containing protein [Verrucomicrobiae bacterium]